MYEVKWFTIKAVTVVLYNSREGDFSLHIMKTTQVEKVSLEAASE